MKIQKLNGVSSSTVLVFLLATAFNRKLVSKYSFITFHLLKKNNYFFNAYFLLYLCGPVHLLSFDLLYIDNIIKRDLPCLFCVYNGYIYLIHSFCKISDFILFLDFLSISFLFLLNMLAA